jgi:protein phosphatase
MKSYAHTHQGKRSNQEDSLGFLENKCYIICDGVGGHSKGEVASNSILNFLLNAVEKIDDFNKNLLQNIISAAQENLNQKLGNFPEAEGMGTTLAAVFLSKDAYFVAHLGDSRVYFIKPKEQKIWHTWDHSLVGNLMQLGEISREVGRFHPNSNRIDKAIIANKENKTSKADIAKISQSSIGDLIFICSDGITEVWSEYELLKILCDSNLSSKEKIEVIGEKCQHESKDNNSAFLLEVDENSTIETADNEEINWLTLDYFKSDFEEYLEKNQTKKITNISLEVDTDIQIPVNTDVDSTQTLETESKQSEVLAKSNFGSQAKSAPKKVKKTLLIFLTLIGLTLISYFIFKTCAIKTNNKTLSGVKSFQNQN